MKKNSLLFLSILMILTFIILLYLNNNDNENLMAINEAEQILDIPILLIENKDINSNNPEVYILNTIQDIPYGYHVGYNYYIDYSDETKKRFFVSIYGLINESFSEIYAFDKNYEILNEKYFKVNNIKVKMIPMKDKRSKNYKVLYEFYIQDNKYYIEMNTDDYNTIHEVENVSKSLIIGRIQSL